MATQDFCRENRERIISASEEVHWLQRTGVAPGDYLRELLAVPEPNVLFVRHGV